MADEILSVKLRELDGAMDRLRSRIRLSQTADPGQRQAELEEIRREYTQRDAALRRQMQFSRSGFVRSLTDAWDELEDAAARARQRFSAPQAQAEDTHPTPEESIVLAEYALDFAMQAANRALALSLEAMNRQPEPSEREEPQ
ncbi:MAG: hypothetical protein LUF28_05265 [Clostridiales bacterium]|nr:hypothetical protein [Clostridiales bacterium]